MSMLCTNWYYNEACYKGTALYSRTFVKRPLKNRQTKVFKITGRLMKVESIAEMLPSAILLTCIKCLSVLKINFRSFWEWSFYTVLLNMKRKTYTKDKSSSPN